MHHATFQHQGAFSFGQSKRNQWYMLQNKEIPGPGTHTSNFSNNSPIWSIGKQKKKASFISEHTNNNAPVGNYNPKQQLIFTSTNKFGIGTSKRDQKLNNLTKDINLNPKYKLAKQTSPSITFGYSQQSNYQKPTPAPNVYDQTVPLLKRSHNRSQNNFTLKQRPPPYGQQVKNPPVGRYNLNKNNTVLRMQIGNGKRPGSEISPDSPGKYYQISKRISQDGAGFSLAGKLPYVFVRDNFPEPNRYNPKYIESRKKIFTVTSNRTDLVQKQDLLKPSPGNYNISGSLEKGIQFPQDKRPQLKESIGPGPGGYEIKSTLGGILGKMAWKLPKAKQFVTPSPFHYSPKKQFVQSRTQQGITYYSKRVDFSISDTKQIGPGAYNIQGCLQKQLGKIGTSSRPKIINKNPGPGQYQIPPTLGRLPVYLKGIKRKISQHGETKLVRYNPQSMMNKKSSSPQIVENKSQEI